MISLRGPYLGYERIAVSKYQSHEALGKMDWKPNPPGQVRCMASWDVLPCCPSCRSRWMLTQSEWLGRHVRSGAKSWRLGRIFPAVIWMTQHAIRCSLPVSCYECSSQVVSSRASCHIRQRKELTMANLPPPPLLANLHEEEEKKKKQGTSDPSKMSDGGICTW